MDIQRAFHQDGLKDLGLVKKVLENVSPLIQEPFSVLTGGGVSQIIYPLWCVVRVPVDFDLMLFG